MKNLLIIGGVAAGATAAARARRLDSKINITLLEAGRDVSFANCGLPYHLGKDIPYRSSLILASEQTFQDQYRVDVHLDTRATAIDREKKVVRAYDSVTGQTRNFPYDSLILALGGKPIVPPIAGADKGHVFSLWNLNDMDAIESYINLRKPKSAVIVGGGFIGLEMAEAMSKRSLAVTIVEKTPHIMPNLETEFAGFLTQELDNHSVNVVAGKSVESIGKNQVVLDDGSSVDADLVLLAIGVRPNVQLAADAGLEIGETGALLVDTYLRTSDPSIYAAGDLIEVMHRISGKSVRMPLAGPANRQGRIAAENALGGKHKYSGVLGSSVVKVFDVVAGSTGLSLRSALDAGFDADAVVVHKVNHTAYYPDAEHVSLMLIWDRKTGKILGAQVAGKDGADKRIDVIATAIAGGMTIDDLAELDLAYAPPFNSPNGPINMAAFTAQNKQSGFSPSILAEQFEKFVEERQPIIVDLRDPMSHSRAHIEGSINRTQSALRAEMDSMSKQRPVVLISDDGQKGHVALRMLGGAGLTEVYNLVGGFMSLGRLARISGLGLVSSEHTVEQKTDGTMIIDVRTPQEFARGAYPDAVNIPLDHLAEWAESQNDKHRKLLLYCASGARSAYGARMLKKMGFTSVENGGGLSDMLSR